MTAITKLVARFADKYDNPLISDAQTHVADGKTDYTDDAGADDLDTDLKRITAQNALNTKINSVLAILEAHGLVKAS